MLRNRRANRCAGFDYASTNAYFVTCCTAGRQEILAAVMDGRMCLSEAGRIVDRCLREMANGMGGGIELVEHVIMPDHRHALIRFHVDVNTSRPGRSLSSVIGSVKSVSARAIHARGLSRGRIWQRSFHDRLIRTGTELERVRSYIIENPARWIADRA